MSFITGHAHKTTPLLACWQFAIDVMDSIIIEMMEKGKTYTAYIALGANLSDTFGNLRSAVIMLNNGKNCIVTVISSLYKTKPVGVEDQPDFINAVVKIETLLSAQDLLKFCNDIEQKLGRKRTIRWGPRVIDIDILLYENVVIKDENLIIPHPRMMERAFVLVPLAEIAPDIILEGRITAKAAANEVDCSGVECICGGSWSD